MTDLHKLEYPPSVFQPLQSSCKPKASINLEDRAYKTKKRRKKICSASGYAVTSTARKQRGPRLSSFVKNQLHHLGLILTLAPE